MICGFPRIADLLLDGTTALGQSDALEAVRDGIRQGATTIDLRGYSHIFISGLNETARARGEQELIADVPHGLQEIFTREDLRNLLKAYEARERPWRASVSGLGEQHPWEETLNSAALRRGSTGPTAPRRLLEGE